MAQPPATEIESLPPELVHEPLNWLFAEHYRHRQLCKIIEHIARSEAFDADRIVAALRFLRQDMPLHVLDEEEDLFPLMRRRASPTTIWSASSAISAPITMPTRSACSF